MDTIIDILTELHPDVDFDTCDTLIDDGILDSFDIVSIISRINEEFDVQITADRITPENFNSAEAIWALVSELLDE
ncbi:MAG TPA: acyl carrier protein [Bacillota bacterium]|nr:acyl carrier protein [Clostridiales bacterium]HOQ13562.1 acyl carrier protein [Bacillota bacterium]HPU17540.1 acyl carrier protein [Bacillota bacterium]